MRKTRQSSTRLLGSALALLGLLNTLVWSMPGSDGGHRLIVPGHENLLADPRLEGIIFAVTFTNKLLSFNSGSPGTILSMQTMTGLQSGESVVGIDFRPATGQLYAVGSSSRVYVINPVSGVATVVGGPAFTPALSGTAYGIDFNPVPDRIRVVSEADQNLRLNPTTGAVAATDTNLAFDPGDPNAAANPNVVSVAYANNFAGTPTTTLYGIDSNLDILVRQGSPGGTPTSPNTGQLFTIGALGVNTGNLVGFDIASGTGAAFASMTASGATTSQLYTINLTSGAATLIGNIGGTEAIRDIAIALTVENVYAVTSGNRLLSFDAASPGTINSSGAITGLATGDSIIGLDFRPATGQLFGLGSSSRLYTIDVTTGIATQVGSAAFTPALSGTDFGFDFNPVPDRIRVVSDADQNLRLNPATGAVAATDTNLAYATGDANEAANPNIVAVAYTNNFTGTPATTLFGIDSTLNTLVRQGSPDGTPTSPNTGQLSTVGPLGVDPGGLIGFDISSLTGVAFAAMTASGASNSQFYTINLTTGAATLIGNISGGETIRDITVEIRRPPIFAVTSGNNLVSFNPGNPGAILRSTAITGLQTGESVTGIDFRPATGQLYAVGSSSRVYVLDTATGAATAVGSGAFTPALSGTAYGVDFNPVPDRIRVVSEADQNLRLNPTTGTVAGTDTNLAFDAGDPNAAANPNVVGVAYSNNFTGTLATTLYGIDSNLDILVRQGSPGGTPTSPNSGQLFTIGALGVNTGDQVGFDIATGNGAAFASLTATGATTSQLYTINLTSGAATLIGNIGGTEAIRDIAIPISLPLSQQGGFALVNSAGLISNGFSAANSFLTLFGVFQTQNGQPSSATAVPLPITLGGVKVSVNGLDAQLLYVSNSQINLIVPAVLLTGPTPVTVTSADSSIRTSTVIVVPTAPGIFSFNGSGQGTAAAVTTTNGLTYLPVYNSDGSPRDVLPGTAQQPNFLVLFGTGIRNAPAGSVTVTINGVPATVSFAGAQPTFAALDQINVIIPPQLTGAGLVKVRVTTGGIASNEVNIRIGGGT